MAAILNLEPIITTTHGRVRGELRKTVYDDEYYCFDGIPYAKPPLGELRFKSPVELEPWPGVRECTTVAQKCLQYNRYTQQIEGSEDCLYLNIYVKHLHTMKPLPVMVYLHGGGYTTGDATRESWGPDYFMMKDVVLITIGSRLGALGFLRLSDPELSVPGNAGIKDQIQALKWIKANCAYFNGDPENITVFGHSSGSGSTHLLMLTPQCIGLFHKAILMAGYHVNIEEVPDLEYRLAKHLGYEGDNDEKEVYKLLSTIDGNKLTNLGLLFTKEEKDRGFYQPFYPRIEAYATDDAVLLKAPIDLLQTAWSNNIPVMLGNTSKEALIQYKRFTNDDAYYALLAKNPEYMLPTDIQSSCDIELQRKLAKKLIALHYGDRPVTIENFECAIDHASYESNYHRTHRLLLARRAKTGNARTYLYRFDFDSPTFNLYRIKHCGPDVRGVGHVDELSYIFYMQTSFKLSRDSAEFKTIQRMVDLWTSFAATSNPSQAASLAPILWQHLDRDKPAEPHKCLNISYELSFIDWPEVQKCQVWDTLYEETGVKLF